MPFRYLGHSICPSSIIIRDLKELFGLKSRNKGCSVVSAGM